MLLMVPQRLLGTSLPAKKHNWSWNQEHLKIFRSGINCPRPNHGGQLANACWVGSFCGHELNFPILLSYTIYASRILKFIRISEKSLVPAKGHFPQSAFFLPFKKLSWCLFSFSSSAFHVYNLLFQEYISVCPKLMVSLKFRVPW